MFGLVIEVYVGIEEVFRSDVYGIYVFVIYRLVDGLFCDCD